MNTLIYKLGPLPEPALEDHDYELWGQNARADFYTAEQMRAVAAQERAAERERCIEIVDRELDSNGQAQAIALAIRGA